MKEQFILKVAGMIVMRLGRAFGVLGLVLAVVVLAGAVAGDGWMVSQDAIRLIAGIGLAISMLAAWVFAAVAEIVRHARMAAVEKAMPTWAKD